MHKAPFCNFIVIHVYVFYDKVFFKVVSKIQPSYLRIFQDYHNDYVNIFNKMKQYININIVNFGGMTKQNHLYIKYLINSPIFIFKEI